MIENLEHIESNNNKSYCIDCGRDVPSEFIPKEEETTLCFYCFRKHRPIY